MQPSFAQFLPVALMIGVTAAFVVYLSSTLSANYPWAGAVWLVFISWALYFMAGAKVSRIHKYAIGLTGGIVAGWLTLAVLSWFTALFGPTLGLPIMLTRMGMVSYRKDTLVELFYLFVENHIIIKDI